jgi:chorismate dehydratase
MWTARPGVNCETIADSLSQARDAGETRLDEIAAAAAKDAGLDAKTCLSYFRDNLHFTLGVDEQQGLQLFRRYATELGFVNSETSRRATGVAES